MAQTIEAEIVKDPVEVAKAAGLRYVHDDGPGIRREIKNGVAKYIGINGKPITDEDELIRIRKLAIPPAYTDVWISPHANGHIQATARDAKGRKQYRYHPLWREVRDENKYNKVLAFGQALPHIRARIEEDLKLPGLPREKVLAAVVRLLETTLIRVGNEQYAKENKSYGLTTMRNRHVKIEGWSVKFQFKGKSGKRHSISVRDRRLANIIKRCRDIPGQELFQYIDDDGEHRTISSHDVNNYLREIGGEDFSAKDFRTWAGTLLAALTLREMGISEKESEAKKNVVRAIESVSEKLGNTPSICRKCYVHPVVLNSYLDGTLVETLQQIIEEEEDKFFSADEKLVLNFLNRKLAA
jgi:DNA topoisomerase I